MLTAYLVDSLSDTNLDDGLTTLREALMAANNNVELWGVIPAGSTTETDIIQFDPSLFTDGTSPIAGTISLASQMGAFSITDPAGVDIQGPGATLLSIDAHLDSQIFYVSGIAQASLAGLELVNGSSDSGGGIYNSGTLILTDAALSSNVATSSEYSYGGAIYNSGNLTIIGSDVSNNVTTGLYGFGGGIYNEGVLSFTDSTLSGNLAEGTEYGAGGAIFNYGTFTVKDSTISDNSTGNTQYGLGGAIYSYGDFSISGSTLTGNVAGGSLYGYGGAIYNSDNFTITGSTISDNVAEGAEYGVGGAICNEDDLTITDSTISNNSLGTTPYGMGGAIYNYGEISINTSTLSDNNGYQGGLAYNNGTLTIRNSTVVNNSSDIGGGVLNFYHLLVTNSTFSGNSADSGGAISTYGNDSIARLTNSTITANSTTTSGGAIDITSDAIAILYNTVVADNTSIDDVQVSGVVLSSSAHNLIGVSTGLTGITDGDNGNQIGTAASPIDPMLGPLADNGGPTLTHAPLPGSPLINAGNDAYAYDTEGKLLLTDQRGLPRRFETVDVGAVEDVPPGLPVAYDDSFNVDQDTPTVLDVLANDYFDGEGSLVVQIVEAPSHGTLVYNPDGTLTYTPELTFLGMDSFSYQAVNGELVSNTVDVVLTVVMPGSIVVTTAVDELDGDLSPNDISLREALQMAEPGSTIQFSAGLLDQVIELDAVKGALEVRDVQIVGLGADRLTIDGCDGCRVFNASGESLISQLTITGGLNSGIYADSDALLTVADCIITDNTSFGGSGIFNNGGTVDVVDCVITNNTITEYAFAGGGGILNRGTMAVTRTVFSNNYARSSQSGNHLSNRGGGILNEGVLVVNDSTFTENNARFAGGGICSFLGAVVTINNCEFLNNQADSYAGGLDICSLEGATVNDSFFTGNVTTNTGGGAIATSKGHTTITRTIIAGNSAESSSKGGGIYCTSGQLTLVESTISGNQAQHGGGIYARESSAVITIINSTIAGNTASTKGGGVANMTEAIVTNSIIALNEAPTDMDFSGTMHADSDFNLIGVNPLFVRNPGTEDALGDLRLQRGSPAINAADNTLAVDAQGDPLTTDLDGNPRTIGGTVDIGAYEHQSVYYVVDSLDDTIADDGLLTLREALQAANTNEPLWNGDVPAGSETASDFITFDPALFTDGTNPVAGQITLGGTQLEILDEVEIEGPGADLLSIDADNQSRVFYVDEGIEASLSDLTVTGGQVVNPMASANIALGGGIYNLGTLTLSGLNVSGNNANAGGGIFSGIGSLTVADSIISDNTCYYGGGGLLNRDGSVLTITNSNVSNNSASDTESNGGGLLNQNGTAALTNATFSANSAGNGGAVANDRGTLTVLDSTFSNNEATGIFWGEGMGGAIYANEGETSITDSTLLSNSANSGGGIFVRYGTAEIALCVIQNNSAINWGGGIASTADTLTVVETVVHLNSADLGGGMVSAGEASITGSSFSANEANNGGGLTNVTGTLTLDDTLITGNRATNNGGGVYNQVGTLSITEATFSDNFAGNSGGGICNLDTLDIATSDLSGNTAIQGGGIYSSGMLDVDDSTFSENVAYEQGGGLYIDSSSAALDGCSISTSLAASGGGIYSEGGTVNLSSSTILENIATGEYGGGIYNNQGTWTLTDTCISDNSADSGAGVYNSLGMMTLLDSTVSDNAAAEHGGGIFSDGGSVVLNGCTLSTNSAGQFGGAILSQNDSTLVADRSSIVGNSATSGAGLYTAATTATITNTILAGNAAAEYGAGILSTVSLLTLTNTTITSNVAGIQGGGVYSTAGTLVVANSILAMNQATSSSDLYGILGSGSGAVLLGIDPGFVRNPSPGTDTVWGTPDDDYGDLHLLSNSLAIDSGSNALAVDAQGDPLETDRDGNPRIIYDVVDIGAYEFHLMADANVDGAVDEGDLTILSSHFGMSEMNWSDGDFNIDGHVNGIDAAILGANWGATWNTSTEAGASNPSVLSKTPHLSTRSLIGPLSAGGNTTPRRLIEPARREESIVFSTTGTLVNKISSEETAAAHDTVFANGYEETQQPQQQELDYQSLSWSCSQARHQNKQQQNKDQSKATLAVDLLLTADKP